MPTTYLLPCDCGKKLPVEAPQAGQTVRCSCGQSMEVPTIRGLAKLQQAKQQEVTKAGSRWGPRQGLLLLGAVITLTAVSASIALQVKANADYEKFTPTGYKFTEEKAERIRQAYEKMSPAQTWREWGDLRSRVGRNSTPTEKKIAEVILYRDEQVAMYQRWRYVTYGIVALGVMLMAATLLFTTSPRAAEKSSKRPPPNRKRSP